MKEISVYFLVFHRKITKFAQYAIGGSEGQVHWFTLSGRCTCPKMLNVKMNLFAFAETQLSRGGFAPPPKSQRSWGSASSTENWRVNVPCRVTLVAVEIVSQARGWYNYYRV